MTAPTEAEIRQAIVTGVDGGMFSTDDYGGLDDAFRVIFDSDLARSREPSGWVSDFYGGDGHPGTLWADLTADETAELHDAMHAVLSRILADATVRLVDECVAAAAAFAKAHPDIPRGRWRPTEAPQPIRRRRLQAVPA